MTTKRVPLDEMKRPRREYGRTLRLLLDCPLCGEDELRVVAFRRHSARMECPKCGLRFSIDFVTFTGALLDKQVRWWR
jgi:transcription elongation factor Elf1